MNTKDQKIAIVGPGAIGTLFAFYLESGGFHVALAGRSPRKTSQNSTVMIRMVTRGNKLRETCVEQLGGSHNARDATPDYVIFSVKAYDTKRASRQWKSLVGPKTHVVSLQNGLGNLEILSKYFDVSKLIIAVTSEASFLSSPSDLHHTARGITKVAPAVNASLPAARRFAEMLQAVGLQSMTKIDAQDTLWGKLVVNSAINPLSAITGFSNGRLLSSESLRKLLSRIASETYEVGVKVAHANPDIEGAINASSYVLKVAATTAGNKSSMLQDVLAGKHTEVDFINGAVCRVARSEAGFDAPLNETMLHLVKALEESSTRKSHYMLSH